MMSSLFIGATGLKSHSEGMSVISNNLANVNTVGYKQMAIQYADIMSQYVTAASANMTNCNQKGMGSVPVDNRTLFTQGGLEKGSAATDLCINGKGFFGVSKNGQTHYTRAGNFRFTKEGELLDPNGWNLLGHAIVNGQEEGAATPVILDMGEKGVGYMPPRATTVLTAVSQLGGVQDSVTDQANPFFSMASSWNGTVSPPLDGYSYGENFQFYDSEGVLRNGTIYYDRAGSTGGLTAMEYLVAMNPSEDASGLAKSNAAGLLMAGTITFASSGEIVNLTAFSPPASGDPTDLSAWTAAPMQDGLPVFSAQPSGAKAQGIGFNIGFKQPNGNSSPATAADAAATPSSVYAINSGAQLDSRASNLYGSSPASTYSANNGYEAGYLRDLQISAEGIVSGVYSNRQTDELYRISLYRFTSEDGLRHEGNNHYSATPQSGLTEEGVPGSENFGTLAEYSLEQSNVDYAREFSLMIITQRGFQMNSKV
ncbi:flagellar hook-basal body complex protein, partial [Desulfovibrio sp. OttesenSCG-928-A18]|nr:flagellar hook-basal body complex protein [Desulfovibrio sp. OttesenSCG-928-A18]